MRNINHDKNLNKSAYQIFLESNNQEFGPDKEHGKVLCKHCKRTLDNGIRCLGMCVEDSDY